MGIVCGDIGIPWALGAHGSALEISQETHEGFTYGPMGTKDSRTDPWARRIHVRFQNPGRLCSRLCSPLCQQRVVDLVDAGLGEEVLQKAVVKHGEARQRTCQHIVSTSSAHGQHTVSTWPEHGQHTVRRRQAWISTATHQSN